MVPRCARRIRSSWARKLVQRAQQFGDHGTVDPRRRVERGLDTSRPRDPVEAFERTRLGFGIVDLAERVELGVRTRGDRGVEQAAGQDASDPADQPHLSRRRVRARRGARRRRREPAPRAARSRCAGTRRRAMCVSVGSHWSTTRTLRSVLRRRNSYTGSAPATRTATAGRSMRSASASSTALGQPTTATISSSSRSGSVAASRFAVRSASSSRSASRAARDRIGRGEDPRAHPPQCTVRGMMREDAAARHDQARGLGRERRRAHPRLRPRARRRRRSGGSRHATARRASRHPTSVTRTYGRAYGRGYR